MITRTKPLANQNDSRGYYQRGFTLIELLVVIAIISLLVSILLPSLQKAKDLAKSTVCQTRMHSLGMNTQMYLNQSDGVYPLFALTPNNIGLPHWQLYLLWAMGEADDAELQSRGNDSEKKNREIFHCPSDTNNTCDLENWATSSYIYMFSYGGNAMLGINALYPDNSWKGWRSVDEVHEPAHVFLLAETTFRFGRHCVNIWPDTPDFMSKWEAWRHPQPKDQTQPWLDGGFNVLFCDGHIENQKDDLDSLQINPLR